jgi:molybdopterin molybdotransferase/putative molybdopterin biosynthesis protein
MSGVQTRLSGLRRARGVGAAELARRAGVTRQAIYAIEAGSYVPNTEIALKLARELEVRVEDLFELPEAETSAPRPVVSEYLGPGPARVGQPVRVCRVGARWISVPSDARPRLLPEADAVICRGRGRASLRFLGGEPDAMSRRIVVAGCDPAASLLARVVERDCGVDVVHALAPSRQALRWLREGKVHIAGTHLVDPDGGDFNRAAVGRVFGARDMAVVTFATWEEGLVVAKGNPRAITGMDDLARKDVRLINRQGGSGSRALLDGSLRSLGIRAQDVGGYEREAGGHLAAAQAVMDGEADCCVATRSAARAFDLDFIPLREERYDFVLDRDALTQAPVAAFLDVLQRAALRDKLRTLAGYDTSGTGEMRA